MIKALSIAFAVLFTSTLSAQVRETVNVRLVEVPVTVIGSDGNPVRGLTAGNFELFDNGRKMTISSFEMIDFKAPDYQSPNATVNPAARRNFMLLFDLAFSSPQSLKRAQKAASDFLAHSLEKRDRAAVATIDVRRGFSLLTAFTTDRSLLKAAITDPMRFVGSDPLQIAAINPVPIPQPVNPDAISEGRFQTQQRIAEMQREQARRQAKFDDEFNRQQVDRELEILEELSLAMRGVYGRKEIVLLSDGFDPSLVQGRTKLMTEEAQREQEAIEKNELWKVDSDKRFGSSASMKLLDRLGEMCRRSDVVLHAIDTRGVRVDNDVQTGATSTSNEGLSMLASATGGNLFKNSNDLTASMSRMLHDQEVVYILAFHAPSSEPGRFHPLKVKLKDVPSVRQVHSRAGYYESGAEGEAERMLATAEIVLNDVPQPDIRVDAVAPVFPGPNGKALVPIVVDVAGADILRWKDDSFVMADIFVYAFDANGEVPDALHQRIMLDTDKVGERLRAGGLKYYGALSLAPGTYALRTLVRLPEIGRNGFTRTDIVVPEAQAVSLTPPLFFDQASHWVLVRGASHGVPDVYPFAIAGEEFVPATVMRSRSGEQRFAVYVANAAPESSALTVAPAAQLLGREPVEGGSAFVFQVDAATVKTTSIDVAAKVGAAQLKSSAKVAPY